LRVPLELRGQEIGSISVKRSSAAPWSEPEHHLMEKLASQVALAVENARLIEETRQRAAQEKMVSEVSARFSRSLDVEALLQAAVREFAALPDVAEATVVLKPAGSDGSQSRN
jgi:sigma-B regulation protein RsbU (phosphoserine phosphatase)